MPVIAMTREIGARGSEVAAGLADRLGLAVVHHELVEHDIAERCGMHERDVHRFLEGGASLLERWTVDQKRLSRFTAQEILELAAKGNVVIRGWGATYLLRSVPHAVCVRICAPMAYREAMLMERFHFKEAAIARREIERSDAAHNGTMQKLFAIDWTDPSLYAIVLNSARIPIADCIDHIVRVVESPQFAETPSSRAALEDELILARIRSAMDRHFGTRSLQYGFDAHVFAGKVVLTGATIDEKLIVDAVRLVQRIEGVKRVESRITHIAFAPHGP